jgi:hypothetical protein
METKLSQETNVAQNSGKMKYYIGALILIVLIICGELGYLYWTKTPQYSLKLVRNAIVEHNLPLFEKHVDIESLVSRAIDQAVEANLNDPNKVQDEGMNNLAAGFVKMIKPQLISAAKDEIKSYIEKGKFEADSSKAATTQSNPSTQPTNNPNISVQQLFGNGSGSAEFKDIEYVKRDGKIAVVGVKIFYPKINHTGILEFKMRELNGYWQVAELNNLNTFLAKIAEAERAKLFEVNKPILDEINNAAIIEKMNASWVNGGTYSRYINFTTQIKFPSPKSISEIGAVITIRDQNDKLMLRYPVKANGNTKPDQISTVNWRKEINPFIKSDETLFNTPANTVKVKYQIQYLKFTDGSELKLIEKLP